MTTRVGRARLLAGACTDRVADDPQALKPRKQQARGGWVRYRPGGAGQSWHTVGRTAREKDRVQPEKVAGPGGGFGEKVQATRRGRTSYQAHGGLR